GARHGGGKSSKLVGAEFLPGDAEDCSSAARCLLTAHAEILAQPIHERRSATFIRSCLHCRISVGLFLSRLLRLVTSAVRLLGIACGFLLVGVALPPRRSGFFGRLPVGARLIQDRPAGIFGTHRQWPPWQERQHADRCGSDESWWDHVCLPTQL